MFFDILIAVVFLVIGLVAGAKYQQGVFEAEKKAEEEARIIYESAKSRIAKAKASKKAPAAKS